MPGRSLFIHASADLYGSDRVLLDMVLALGPGTRACVVLPDDVPATGPLVGALREAGADVRFLRLGILRRARLRPFGIPRLLADLLAGAISCSRLARTIHADVIISNTIAVQCGWMAARLSRRPHLWYVHETLSDEPLLLRLLLRCGLVLAPGRIVANSRATARSIAGRGRRLRRRTRVVYPALVRMPEIAPRDAPPPGRALSAVVVGRLSPRKGIAQAIEALSMLRHDGCDLHLHLFGAPPPGEAWRMDAYRSLAVELGVGDRVIFHGFAADAAARLAGFDILLVPSQRPEGFGLTIVEGMAAGLPIVACRNGGGSDEILVDGCTGLYCGRDPAAIAAALRRLADDAALRATLGAAARRDVMTRFGIDRFQRDIRALYASAACDSCHAGGPRQGENAGTIPGGIGDASDPRSGRDA